MFCPSCGEEIPDASAFCSHCGEEMPRAKPPEGAPAGESDPRLEPGRAQATPEPTGTAETGETRGIVGGLDENVAGALAYLFGFVTGLVFFLIEDDNKFVRFHAMQSIVVFGGLFVIGFVFSILQGMVGFAGFGTMQTAWTFWLIGMFLWLAYTVVMVAAFVLWLMLMVRAYKGEMWSLPIAGGIAKDHA